MDQPHDESENRFLYPAGGRGRYAVLPGVNGGPLFFGTGADTTNGTVYVLSKDMPSILKLVPAGESTAANSGGMIPSHPRNSVLQGRPGVPTTEQLGRALYEQRCQMCHGPELKGDRGPERLSTLLLPATKHFFMCGGRGPTRLQKATDTSVRKWLFISSSLRVGSSGTKQGGDENCTTA